MKDMVTNQQLYEAIMDVHRKIDDVVETRITPLEIWRAELVGRIAILTAGISFVGYFLIDWAKEKLKNI